MIYAHHLGYVFLTSFFFQIIIIAFGIKCWDCRSDTDPKCADPFDNSTVPIKDCKQESELEHLPGIRPTMCRKIRQKGKKYHIFTSMLLYIKLKNK